MRVTFDNGICTTTPETHDHCGYVSKLMGGFDVRGIYNATHGILTDLRESFLNLWYVATDPVYRMHQEWDDFFANSSPDACLLHICHSQGAIHTRNALLSYPKELRDRILVVAIAPAAYMYPDTCKQVWHYCTESALRDPIPRLDIAGRYRSKDTIRYLPSHKDASLHDHSFQSPTYMGAIKKHTANYFKSGFKEI